LNTTIDEIHPGRAIQLDDIIRLLIRRGVISAEMAKQATDAIRSDDKRHPLISLGEIRLVDQTNPRARLNTEALTRHIASACNMDYVRIDPLKIDVETVTGLVSQAYATRFQFLPLEVTANIVTIATSEPYMREWETELAPVLKRDIRRVLANPSDIAKYLKEFYGVSRSLFGAATKIAQENAITLGGFEQLTELGRVGELDANDRHVVHLVDWLLQYAFDQRASDIHIEPRRVEGNIRFRIDGVLHVVHQLAPPIMAAITSRLIELRLSTMPTTFGEKLVLRIFNPEKLTQPFSALGFTRHDERLWREMTAQPHGIILVTGPTGSGKTTTLYSALKQIARPEINVCTIEDPIEMVEPSFNQMQVQPAIDLDFAAGVRTLMRQDPDTIMIGEIRDRETADVAAQAALTGHLVLSTLHTNDAPSAITRLMDIGVPSYLIGATLLGVVAQRLVRTLCEHCKTPGAPVAAVWQSFIGARRLETRPDFHHAVGCDECRQTGYSGREGIYEILTVSSELSQIIQPDVQAQALRRQALQDGMHPLRWAGAQKVAAGRTTLEEVLSVVPATADDKLPADPA
jgi:general secretion pathway protein E